MGYLESSAWPILADVVSYTLQNFFYAQMILENTLVKFYTVRKKIGDYNLPNTNPPPIWGGVVFL